MKDLFAAAEAAYRNAYAPYSRFPVGAAVRARSGAIFAGANVENLSFPLGACAEASAISAMASAGEREIVEIAVIGGGEAPISPCGGCRQRLAEFAAPATPVWLCSLDGDWEKTTMAELLPRAFAEPGLGLSSRRDVAERREARDVIAERAPGFAPEAALVLGSGLSALADALDDPIAISYSDLPGFPVPSVEGHHGELRLGALKGVRVAMLCGRAHYYESGDASAMAIPIRALKALGAEFVLLTNAAGSLRADVGPGSAALIEDHINMMGSHPLLGPNDPTIGPRFPDLTNLYDAELRGALARAGERVGVELASGTYLAWMGPSFETPAEIRAFRTLGADWVGMSTAPEAILARHCGLRVVALSAITNLAAGMSGQALSHEETLAGAKVAGEKIAAVIAAFFEDRAARRGAGR